MSPISKENPICPEFIVGIEPPADRMEKALWFIFRGREILLKVHKNPGAIPRLVDLRELGLSGIREQYLGTLKGTHCYSVELPDNTDAPEGMKFVDLRQAYSEINEECFALVNKAVQIMEWDSTNQFCSRCGTKTLQKPGERGKECPECGELFYPRISPAVIVLVIIICLIIVVIKRKFKKNKSGEKEAAAPPSPGPGTASMGSSSTYPRFYVQSTLPTPPMSLYNPAAMAQQQVSPYQVTMPIHIPQPYAPNLNPFNSMPKQAIPLKPVTPGSLKRRITPINVTSIQRPGTLPGQKSNVHLTDKE